MNAIDKVFQSENTKLLSYGKYVSLTLAIATLITFGFAMIAVPISGSNAPQNSSFSFPYLNTLSQFPRDFIWQYLALVQLVIFMAFITLIKQNTKKDAELFSNLANSFAMISVTVLVFTYYTQVMVVPSSLTKGETDGLALLIQYNPHGLFIALEELGYIMMSLSLLSLVPIAKGKNKGYRSIRIVLIVASILTLVSCVAFTYLYGLEKQDRLEVAIISINWIALMILGVLFFRLYGREEKSA